MRTTCCIRTYGAASGSTSRTSRGQETEGRCLRHGLEPLRRRVKPVAMYTSRENQVRTPLRPPTHIMLPAVVKLCDFLIRRHGTRIHQVCLRHTQWCREYSEGALLACATRCNCGEKFRNEWTAAALTLALPARSSSNRQNTASQTRLLKRSGPVTVPPKVFLGSRSGLEL